MAMSGERLAPLLPAVAEGVAAGVIGVEQARIIRKFADRLPARVAAEQRHAAQEGLAAVAAEFPPEDVHAAAHRLTLVLDPDGDFSDAERSRKRAVSIGAQGLDKMSRISGWISPELRATLEAVLAKLAAPGRCNPDDEHPAVDGAPTQAQIDGDGRTSAQRAHDALTAGLRALLASGALGQHNGLPVSIVVSTTLQDLEAARGCGYTGGGTLLPMTDVIRLARHAHHYLAVFDKHTGLPLYLGRSRRTASPGQRLVLMARERGCTHPGCTSPGYQCEVHHIDEWRDGGHTDIDKLTLVCCGNHRMIDPAGWSTTKNAGNVTEWIPPPHLDIGQPRTNDHHHPERLLSKPEPDEPGG